MRSICVLKSYRIIAFIIYVKVKFRVDESDLFSKLRTISKVAGFEIIEDILNSQFSEEICDHW